MTLVGSVHSNGDAIVQVRVRGPGAAAVELDTVVDTGFNDWLAIPQAVIDELSLPFREEGRYTLADGSTAVTRLFAAEVNWFGRWRRILVVEMDGGPLMGMALLRGCHLGVDVVDGGRVEIRSLGAR